MSFWCKGLYYGNHKVKVSDDKLNTKLTYLHNSAIGYYCYDIGIPNGTQPVGYDDHSATWWDLKFKWFRINKCPLWPWPLNVTIKFKSAHPLTTGNICAKLDKIFLMVSSLLCSKGYTLAYCDLDLWPLTSKIRGAHTLLFGNTFVFVPSLIRIH